TWRWNGSDWQQVAIAGPTTPPSAFAFGLTSNWQGQALLFGGEASGSSGTWVLAGDTWVSDTRTPAPTPTLRVNSRVTFDLQRDRVLLFGGFDINIPLGDTWEYELQPVATWHASGAGCPGAAGVPLLQPANGARPVLGQPFALQLQSITGGALAALAVGFSDATWSGGPLPASLASIGMPGCSLLVSPDAMFLASASAAGVAGWTLALPNTPAFAGTRLFAQGFALDPTTNALGAVAANAGTAVVGIL